MQRVAGVLLVLVGLAACRSDRTHPRDAIPAELAAPVAVAEAAMDALQQRLAARLAEELGKGGALAAVSVCSEEAPTIAAEVAEEHGVAVGRTSHKLRSEANAPRPWLETFVDRALTEPITGTMVVELGDKVGVVRPIFTAGPCLQCHGTSGQVAPDVAAALNRKYPEDRALGFSDGQLRGFLWAEAPR